MIEYILLFIVYIILHIIIGKVQKNKTKELEVDPYNEVLKKEERNFKHLFNWFPFIFVVILVLILLL